MSRLTGNIPMLGLIGQRTFTIKRGFMEAMNYLDFFKMFDVFIIELVFRSALFILLLVSFMFSSVKQTATTEKNVFVVSYYVLTAAFGFFIILDFRSFALALSGHNIFPYSYYWLNYLWIPYSFFAIAYANLLLTRTFSRK